MKILVYYQDGLAAIFWFHIDVLMIDVQKAAERLGKIKHLEFRDV